MIYKTVGFALLIIATGGFSAAASGQNAADKDIATEAQPDSTEATAEIGESIDEITVTGQQTPAQLQRVVIQARLDFWDIYNTLNTVDDYRVKCRRVAPAGSNIKKLRCVPNYYAEAMSILTQERILLNGPPPDDRQIQQLVAQQKAQADLHMIGLIEANPRLLRQYEKLLQASKDYEAATQPVNP